MIIRIISFLFVLVSALFLPSWFFVLATLIYGFVYQPYELLLIAIMIDVQFGDVGNTLNYYYSGVVILISLILLFLKPQLRVKQK